MWNLNVLFWLIMAIICIGTVGYRLPETIKRFKAVNAEAKNKREVFFKDFSGQIILIISGLACLILSLDEIYTIGKRKIMTPGDLSQEIYMVEQQMEVPYGAIVAIKDGKGTSYLVMNPSPLDPEISHVRKDQQGKTWALIDSVTGVLMNNSPEEPNAQ